MAEPQVRPQIIAGRHDEFFRHETFEALARTQGVHPANRIEDFQGGWPEDELEDGFEEALLGWRRSEVG